MVDADPDGPGHPAADPGGLELLQREAAPGANLDVVLERRAPDDGPEGLDGPRGDGGGLGHAGAAPALLARGLVEPRLHVALPVLVEVRIRHHLVPLRRHLRGIDWPEDMRMRMGKEEKQK